MSTTNADYKSLIDRITAFRKSASANSESDSTFDKSQPAVPQDPEAKKKKQGMPADQGNQEHMHGETDGNEQSEVKPTAPKNVAPDNDNVSKMANNISDIAARAAALLQGTQAQAQTPAEPTKQAANFAAEAQSLDAAIELSPEFHFKLASAILETEEGIKMAESVLMRHKGQQEAHALIKDAMVAHGEFVKAAAEQQQLEQLEALIIQDQLEKNAAVEELSRQLSLEEQSEVVKIASAHAAASEVLNEFEKQAYAAGAADAENMMAGEEGAGEAEDMEGGASLEELLQVLGMLVQSGEIDEATAQQVAEQLMAAEGGEGESAESPEEEAGEEAAKSASAILQHLGA